MSSYIMFSIVMLATSILLCILGIMIFCGKTNLIHDYHQTWVKDKKAYGKAFGRGLCGMSFSFLASGVISLVGHSDEFIYLSLCVLLILFLISGLFLIRVQANYNKREV